jgi:prepilin-type N-terminal cleavage/methylation domain-containing protein
MTRDAAERSRRRSGRTRGYTILELLIVVVIVSILATIVAVGGLRVGDVMADRDARSKVDRVVLAQRGWASRNLAWADTSANLVIGRGITTTSGVSTGPTVVSFAEEEGIRLGVAVLSSSGECQAKFAGDPVTSSEENWVDIPAGYPCSGQSAIAVSR